MHCILILRQMQTRFNQIRANLSSSFTNIFMMCDKKETSEPINMHLRMISE